MTDRIEPRSFVVGPWEPYAAIGSGDGRALKGQVTGSPTEARAEPDPGGLYGTFQSSLISRWQVENR